MNGVRRQTCPMQHHVVMLQGRHYARRPTYCSRSHFGVTLISQQRFVLHFFHDLSHTLHVLFHGRRHASDNIDVGHLILDGFGFASATLSAGGCDVNGLQSG
jgi:hypothetical protein